VNKGGAILLKVEIEFMSGDILDYECSNEQAIKALERWINSYKYIELGETRVYCFNSSGDAWIKNIKFEMINALF